MNIENRDSFFSRIQPYLSPSEIRDIQLAYTLAKYSHRAQYRKETDLLGNPLRYFEHVRKASLVLIDEVKVIDRDMIIGTLLHDCMEDTDLSPEMIEHCFGRDVVTIVKTLSKVPKEGYLDRFKQSVDWRPYVIKGCDRLDNLRSLNPQFNTQEFRLKQIKETEEKYLPLFERMVFLTPIVYSGQVSHLRELITLELKQQQS